MLNKSLFQSCFFIIIRKINLIKKKDLSELQSNNIDNKIKEILNSNILDVQSRSNITLISKSISSYLK